MKYENIIMQKKYLYRTLKLYKADVKYEKSNI